MNCVILQTTHKRTSAYYHPMLHYLLFFFLFLSSALSGKSLRPAPVVVSDPLPTAFGGEGWLTTPSFGSSG